MTYHTIMKKSLFPKLLFSLVFILFFINLKAQERFQLNAIIGLNVAQIDGDLYAGYDKPGLLAGLQVDAILKEKLTLGVGIAYSMRGSQSSFNLDNSNVPFKITTNYVEVPVRLKYKDWLINDEDNKYYRIHFFVGPGYSRLINSELENGFANPTNIGDFFSANDFFIHAGATVYLNYHFGIGAKWHRSIVRLYNPNDNGIIDGITISNSFFAKHLTFYATYRL